MRDIRSDLRERLDALKEKIRSHEKTLSDLRRQAEGVAELLADEEVRWDGKAVFPHNRPRAAGGGPPDIHVRDFTLLALRDGKPRALQYLRDEAVNRGYFHDSNSPGRSMQAILMGLLRSGLVAKTESGDWAITVKGSAACEKEPADPLVHHQ